MADPIEFTKPQQEFLDQMARKLMVDWCHHCLGSLAHSGKEGDYFINGNLDHRPYLAYAVSKKWISIKEERPDKINTYRILSAGWQTGARFLKR